MTERRPKNWWNVAQSLRIQIHENDNGRQICRPFPRRSPCLTGRDLCRRVLQGPPTIASTPFSRALEPTGGSESWPRPGIAGLRPLAGDGVSRRPKAVSNPRYQGHICVVSPGGATDSRLRRKPQSSCPDICRRSAAGGYFGGWNPGAHAPGYPFFAAPRLEALSPKQLPGVTFSVSPGESWVGR